MVVSYKEIQSLAGFSALIYEFKEVFEDIEQGSIKYKNFNKKKLGKFESTITSKVNGQEIHDKQNLNSLEKGA